MMVRRVTSLGVSVSVDICHQHVAAAAAVDDADDDDEAGCLVYTNDAH